MVAVPAATFLARRRVDSVVWIQARLSRRRWTSRSGVLWGSINRRRWPFGEVRPASTSGTSNHDAWWLISTKVTDGLARSRDLNLGNPTVRPLRVPFFEDRKLSRAAAAAATPDRKACMDTSVHHGAASYLAAFHSLPRE